MAASARAFFLSRVTDLSLKPLQPPPSSISRQLLGRQLLPATGVKTRPSSISTVVSCLVSGVDGGGVSDDFVSTQKTGFDREFSVIANMLKRIEPLDTSVISKGVSDFAKDSMKQTISTMLGLLPSDQFSVTVRVSRHPLDRLLVSSIITGYTLWNAEYRISLMRNFDLSTNESRSSNSMVQIEDSKVQSEQSGGCVGEVFLEELERFNPQGLGDLPVEALSYIQQLQSDLNSVKKELNDQKLENMQMEFNRGNNNDLLEYLRSLESDMVTELSRPSSLEVEEVIHELVQNILQRFFEDEKTTADFMGILVMDTTEKYIVSNDDYKLCPSICTSRDYLAKLLFWCMLLGHHLRGLENRLHLSCVVGLL